MTAPALAGVERCALCGHAPTDDVDAMTDALPLPLELLHLDINTAARAIGFSRRYIEQQIKDGKLRAVQLAGRRRVRACDLRDWLAANSR